MVRPSQNGLWTCPACEERVGEPLGRNLSPEVHACGPYPSNVELAIADEPNLDERFEQVRVPEKERLAELIREKARVSVNIHPEVLIGLLIRRQRLGNFHDMLDLFVGYDEKIARERLGFDYLAFGRDAPRVVYGALNLGSPGVPPYGAACVFLKRRETGRFVSFLEKGALLLLKDDDDGIHLQIPNGSRALYPTVAKLAIVKHQEELAKGREFDIENVVCAPEKGDDNCIEAQVCCNITSDTIEKIAYYPDEPRPVPEHSAFARNVSTIQDSFGVILEALARGSAIPFEQSPSPPRPLSTSGGARGSSAGEPPRPNQPGVDWPSEFDLLTFSEASGVGFIRARDGLLRLDVRREPSAQIAPSSLGAVAAELGQRRLERKFGSLPELLEYGRDQYLGSQTALFEELTTEAPAGSMVRARAADLLSRIARAHR